MCVHMLLYSVTHRDVFDHVTIFYALPGLGMRGTYYFRLHIARGWNF
jgi:hypothetical protein